MERDSIDEILNYEFEAFEENDGQYWLSKETEANFDREKCCLLKSIFTFAGPKNWLKIQKTSQSLEKQNLKNSESVMWSWSLDPKLWPCVPIEVDKATSTTKEVDKAIVTTKEIGKATITIKLRYSRIRLKPASSPRIVWAPRLGCSRIRLKPASSPRIIFLPLQPRRLAKLLLPPRRLTKLPLPPRRLIKLPLSPLRFKATLLAR